MMVYDVIERRLLLLLLSFSACEYKRAVSNYSRDKYETKLVGFVTMPALTPHGGEKAKECR
jgi:hypothetical protein